MAKLIVAGAALALIESLSAKLRIFRAPEYLAMAFLLAVLGLLVHLLAGSGTPMHSSHMIAELLKLLAASLLLISFAMLSRRRTQRLITLFAWQGAMLFLSTLSGGL